MNRKAIRNKSSDIATRKVARAEAGASLVLVIFALIPILALLAMAVDGFALLTSKLEQHNNAEYAALSALGVAIDLTTNIALPSKIPAAIAQAEFVAGKNRYIGNRGISQVAANELKQGKAGTVKFGFFRKVDRTFVIGGVCAPTGKAGSNGVQIKLTTQGIRQDHETSRMRAIFSGVFGYKEFDSKSQAIAYWDADRRLKSFATPDTRVIERNKLDVNGDGVITLSDYNLILNYLNSAGSSSTRVGEFECLDVNADGFISSQDMSDVQGSLN